MPDIPGDVDFAERGQGPALLFVPGSFGTGAGWKAVIDKLGSGAKVLAGSGNQASVPCSIPTLI